MMAKILILASNIQWYFHYFIPKIIVLYRIPFSLLYDTALEYRAGDTVLPRARKSSHSRIAWHWSIGFVSLDWTCLRSPKIPSLSIGWLRMDHDCIGGNICKARQSYKSKGNTFKMSPQPDMVGVFLFWYLQNLILKIAIMYIWYTNGQILLFALYFKSMENRPQNRINKSYLSVAGQ